MSNYIFNKSRLQEKIKTYKKNYLLFYPCKVNSMSCVLNAMIDEGCCFEIDSINMLNKLIQKGVSPNKIMYNFLIRTSRDISLAIKNGIRIFTVDNINDIMEIEKSGAIIHYMIRLSIKEFLQEKNDSFVDKWGASVSETKKIIEYIKNKTNSLVWGISFYYPQEFNEYHLIVKTIDTILNEFNNVQNEYYIDIGGGISVEESVMIAQKYKSVKNKLIIEPGRHLIGDCIDLSCTILDVRQRDAHSYVFVDVSLYSGFVDLIIKKHRFDIVCNECDVGRDMQKVIIMGCTSDVSDCFGIYDFPKSAIKKGNMLTIKDCGAYCPEMHMKFCGHKINVKKMELLDGREPPSLPNEGSILL